MDGNGVRRAAPRLQLGACVWCGEVGRQGPDRKVVKDASCLKVPVVKWRICWVFQRPCGRSFACVDPSTAAGFAQSTRPGAGISRAWGRQAVQRVRETGVLDVALEDHPEVLHPGARWRSCSLSEQGSRLSRSARTRAPRRRRARARSPCARAGPTHARARGRPRAGRRSDAPAARPRRRARCRPTCRRPLAR